MRQLHFVVERQTSLLMDLMVLNVLSVSRAVIRIIGKTILIPTAYPLLSGNSDNDEPMVGQTVTHGAKPAKSKGDLKSFLADSIKLAVGDKLLASSSSPTALSHDIASGKKTMKNQPKISDYDLISCHIFFTAIQFYSQVIIQTSYGFEMGNATAVREHTQNLVIKRKSKSAFTCCADDGIKWAEYYDPLPCVMFALTLTMVFNNGRLYAGADIIQKETSNAACIPEDVTQDMIEEFGQEVGHEVDKGDEVDKVVDDEQEIDGVDDGIDVQMDGPYWPMTMDCYTDYGGAKCRILRSALPTSHQQDVTPIVMSAWTVDRPDSPTVFTVK
ncbi:hypothetical protein V8E55_010022 [Tylopilus felleus]